MLGSCISSPHRKTMDINGLCKVIMQGDRETVKELVDDMVVCRAPYYLNDKNDDGQTPLICAVLKGDPTIVKLLLDCDETDLDVWDEKFWTPLHWACWGTELSHIECLEMIVSHPACWNYSQPSFVNRKDGKGYTALALAVYFGNLEAVRILAKFDGIDIDTRIKKGTHPLILQEIIIVKVMMNQKRKNIRKSYWFYNKNILFTICVKPAEKGTKIKCRKYLIKKK